jgi:hypothetical protein
VSFIDEHTFGDLKSFREQFANLSREQVFNTLKTRLKPVCHRTLRRQVMPYIKYTQRLPILEKFTPAESEDRLYHLVSEYLQRDNLQALPSGQRSLMTLVLRKLLASSTFAIAGAMTTMANRLKAKLRSDESAESLEEALDQEYEALATIADEWGEEEPAERLSGADRKAIEQEIAEKAVLQKRQALIQKEIGEHCHTHIMPRMKIVIDGQDQSGITKAVNWKGGGGFRYYRLASSLLEKDKWGNWVINKTYNAAMLAEALCKLEGFTYAPSDAIYWQHGHSTEQDFIYVTTANLTHDQLQQLSDEVGSDRSLLVLCTAFRARADRYPNLTVKKIPRAVLVRCEWGHDDYSLRVENLPQAPPPKGQMDLFGEEPE